MRQSAAFIGEWTRFCFLAAAEFCRSGLICLPPSWVAYRRHDPYPFYAFLRARSPIHRSSMVDGVILSTAADVYWGLTNDRLTSDITFSRAWKRAARGNATSSNGDSSPSSFAATRPLILGDGESHARCRDAVITSIERASQEPFEQRLEERVQQCLSNVPKDRVFDLMSELIVPLVRETSFDLLGLGNSQRSIVAKFMRPGLTFALHHGDRLVRFSYVMASDCVDSTKLRTELRCAIRVIMQDIEVDANPGVFLELKRAVARAELTADESLGMAEELVAATFEPVANSLGNSLAILANRPDLYERLRSNPREIPPAARELARYDAAVQAVFRYAKEKIVLRGHPILPGEQVVLLLGSANRDSSYFEDADRIDFGRSERRHFSFGKGRHTCIGMKSMTLFSELVLSRFISRFRSIRLAAKPLWQSSLPLRGPSQLPLLLQE